MNLLCTASLIQSSNIAGLHFVTLPGIDVKKNVIVTISSDKGLCGGINSTSVKMSRAIHKLNSGILANPCVLSCENLTS